MPTLTNSPDALVSIPGERKTTLWVLGVNIGLHDASAALLGDGQLVAMVEQERLSRNKRALGEAPVEAIKFCLEYAGIGLGDVTAVGLGTDMQRLRGWQGLTATELRLEPQLDDPLRLFPPAVFGDEPRPSMIPVLHHLAHAASAFWPSGFDEAAILVVDNRGEDASTCLAYGRGADIVVLEQYDVPVSLGLYYRSAAEFAGLYGKHGEVGKFMGLASYGRPTERVPLDFDGEGPILRDVQMEAVRFMRGKDIPDYVKNQLLAYFARHCFPYTPGLSREIMAYANFANSVQQSLEATLLRLTHRLKVRTGSANLVIAGGVGLNCTANGKIADSGLFEGLFVQPVAHDGGVALGAALHVSRQLQPTTVPGFRMDHVYWGPEFSQEEINARLDRLGVIYTLLDEDALVDEVADALAAHLIVGWFQGRTEVGPRALGARSLLGNPTTRETLVRLNTIKCREMWRPLAPSVLAEEFAAYFTGPMPSPFMTIATRVRPDVRAAIPAVVHVDDSSRPQVVTRQGNSRYWKLIKAFWRRTGIPLIVNTSFNGEGEPIVNTPEEAVRNFLNTDIDVLAVGRALAVKAQQARP